MQLHRHEATDDKECGNLEFLCTMNTPSSERMKYLLDLCKEKRTAHLRRALLETQDLLRIPLLETQDLLRIPRDLLGKHWQDKTFPDRSKRRL